MSIKGKKVLVTGAGGFIGSHLVQRLIHEGASVRAMLHYRGKPDLHNLDYLSAQERDLIEIVRGNIEDAFFVRNCVEGCELVFHLAALIAIPYSYVAPASYVSTNITGTLNVLEAARSVGTKRLIHTSTSECYGTACYTPIDESHPLQAQSPYSASKIAADKLVESYHLSFGLPAVTVRPFNTFGPRQSNRAVIPTIISQVFQENPIVKLGSLSPIRDLTYVDDTVDGFVKASLTDSAEGHVINLGTGEGISIGDLAQLIFDISGNNPELETEAERIRPEKSEVLTLISNNQKAFDLIGWKPTVSLKDGLSRTFGFFKKSENNTTVGYAI